MVHIFQRLTALGVKRLKEPGLYADGGGLYLQVTPNGRSWIFRFRSSGKRRDMGLGSLRTIELSKARELAAAARALVFAGKDPIAMRDADRTARQLEANKAKTFEECAAELIEAKKAGWKNKKHAGQWGQKPPHDFEDASSVYLATLQL